MLHAIPYSLISVQWPLLTYYEQVPHSHCRHHTPNYTNTRATPDLTIRVLSDDMPTGSFAIFEPLLRPPYQFLDISSNRSSILADIGS
jgi:hypothetical protein